MESQPTRRDLVKVGALALGVAGLGVRSTALNLAPDDEQRRQVLDELLTRNRKYHPIYNGGLANHLSMELGALHGLGASAERLRAFSATYSQRLQPFPEGGPAVSKETWVSQLGQAAALPGFASFFRAELREHGREAALRTILGQFAPSMASELFHGLIRTAYALEHGDDAEIAHGLAYWAIKPLPLGALEKSKGGEPDFAALLARVRATPSLANASLSGSSNPGRMQQAARLDGFAELAGSLAIQEDTLDRLARAVLALYATTRDFTALHAVTSTHALRILLPCFPERELALRYHAQGLLAAYVRIGAPAIDAGFPSQPPAWEATIAKAVASEDDHDAKLVYSCVSEQRARGDALYQFAAARRVG